MNDSIVTKFYACKYRNEIKKRDVVRETDSSVWVKNLFGETRRRNKVSSTDRYCDTWEEAHAYLLEVAESQVAYHKNQLQRARSELGQIKSMKPLN